MLSLRSLQYLWYMLVLTMLPFTATMKNAPYFTLQIQSKTRPPCTKMHAKSS